MMLPITKSTSNLPVLRAQLPPAPSMPCHHFMFYTLFLVNATVKEAPYGSAYFWTFRRYVCINKYVIFFLT